MCLDALMAHIFLSMHPPKMKLTMSTGGLSTVLMCRCNPPDTGPHQLTEPGIPAREAGALTRNAKGYSL